MRTFEHFPKEKKCPICGGNGDRECFLMPIAGTQEGRNCEAQPTHVDCVKDCAERMNLFPKSGVIGFPVAEGFAN